MISKKVRRILSSPSAAPESPGQRFPDSRGDPNGDDPRVHCDRPRRPEHASTGPARHRVVRTWIGSPCLTPLFAAAVLVTLAGCAESDAAPSISASTRTVVNAGASTPTIALGDEGTAYISWIDMSDGIGSVRMSRLGPHGEAMEAITVNDIAGDVSPHAQAPAQIAAGADGALFVVWQNRTEVPWLDFGASDVRFSHSEDGGASWAPAITVNDNPAELPARNTFHNISVAPDGSIYVSWIDARVRDGFRGDVYRSTGERPAPEDEPGTEIRIARSTDGGASFEPSAILETNSCPCCRTSMAIAPDGTLYVAYRKIYPGEIRDIVVVRSDDGGKTFAEPQRVHADGWVIPGCPHAGPSLAVDPAGRLHVAWFTGSEMDPGAFYAASDDGARTFSVPLRLTPEGPLPTSLATVAADEEGDVWVAWEDLDGEERRIGLAKVESNGTLTRAAVQSPQGVLPALDATHGKLVMAWQQGDAVKLAEVVTP